MTKHFATLTFTGVRFSSAFSSVYSIIFFLSLHLRISLWYMASKTVGAGLNKPLATMPDLHQDSSHNYGFNWQSAANNSQSLALYLSYDD
jgi:hypothetical protein